MPASIHRGLTTEVVDVQIRDLGALQPHVCTSATSFEKQVWSLYKNRKNEIWTYQSLVQGTGRDMSLTRPTDGLG